MINLRCKPGDLAMMVGGNPKYLGWIVECIQFFPGPETLIVPGRIVRATNFWDCHCSRLPERNDKGRFKGNIPVHDCYLMPIRPDELDDDAVVERVRIMGRIGEETIIHRRPLLVD